MSEVSGSSPIHIRASERYGGSEAVGAALWLEHVAGIKFTTDDGSERFLRPQDLAYDEQSLTNNPRLELIRSMEEDVALVTREAWLRKVIFPMMPLKIVGDPSQPPVIFNADLKVFAVPHEMTINPTVDITSAGVLDHESGGFIRDFTQEKAIAFGLRFVPEQGEVAGFGYYPGYTGTDYGIGAVEQTADLTRLQLHHRIYFELYNQPQDQELPSLIAPHQF